MKLIVATVTDVDGTEAEPVAIEANGPFVILTLDDGTAFQFDEVELSGAIFQEAHGLREAS